MSLRILFILIVTIVIGTFAFPQPQQQQPQNRVGESPVIFIDFNYDGKLGGEKSQRSLDQVAYEDGSTRARSTFKDSYGNPVSYDSLDDVDNQRPSNNKDKPFQYVIPGYASGILDPNETPTRSTNFDFNQNQEARQLNDDRIHFLDRYATNVFTQNVNRLPQQSTNSQKPIDIPRPNLDLSETPVQPINDPLNPENIHLPPNALASGGFAATNFDNSPPHLSQGISPPEKPINDPLNPENIHLPPNALASGGVAAANIDKDLSTQLSQGLTPPINDPLNPENIHLPPNALASGGVAATTNNDDITAPELSQGLSPPVLPTNLNFDYSRPQSIPDNDALNQGLLPPPLSSKPTSNTFNNQDGPVIITDDQTVFAPKPSNGLQPPKDPRQENTITPTVSPFGVSSSSTKFTGTFTGSLTPSTPTSQQTFQDIPVIVVQSPPQKVSGNKFHGTFGGSSGVLSSTGQNNRITPTPSTHSVSSTNSFDRNRFSNSGFNFGGAPGILGGSNVSRNPLPSASTTQNTFVAPSSTASISKAASTPVERVRNQFGGPSGILQPYDNNKQ